MTYDHLDPAPSKPSRNRSNKSDFSARAFQISDAAQNSSASDHHQRVRGLLIRQPIDHSVYSHCWYGSKVELKAELLESLRSQRKMFQVISAVCEGLTEPIVILLRDTGVAVFQPGGKISRVFPDRYTGVHKSDEDRDQLLNRLVLRLAESHVRRSDLITAVRKALR